MKKDYYAILGVNQGAPEKEIRSAFKRLARRYHPDVNPGDAKAEEKFKEISEAYAVLSDPEKKKRWEQGEQFDFESFFRGQGGFSFSGGGVSGAGGLDEILSELFGGGAAGGFGRSGFRSAPGADLQYEASIGFLQAVQGTELEIPLARTVHCGQCHGTGRAAGSSGPCPRCRGTGTERRNETIRVKIPAGVDDGARVRVGGKGEAGSQGGPQGDLYVVLRVRPHPYFTRQGEDIILNLPLTVGEAALGTKIDVPTIDGKVSLSVPPGSSSGRRLRLRGRGVPSRSGTRGDQIVVVQIITPERPDSRSRELLEEFDQRNPISPRSDLGW